MTVALITGTLAVSLWQGLLRGGPGGAAGGHYLAAVREFGVVPCRLSASCPDALATVLDSAPAPWLTLLTATFLHGGILHVGANMLYLWIFGGSVEEAVGHGRFFLFYLLCGAAAAGAHVLRDPTSTAPLIGASGAVSGVLVGFLVLRPLARVSTLVTAGFLWRLVQVPALAVLGAWVAIQAVEGLLFGRDVVSAVTLASQLGGGLAGLLLPLLRGPSDPRSRGRRL